MKGGTPLARLAIHNERKPENLRNVLTYEMLLKCTERRRSDDAVPRSASWVLRHWSSGDRQFCKTRRVVPQRESRVTIGYS